MVIDSTQILSRENLALIERGFEALFEGDVDYVVDAFHREVELQGAVGGLEEGDVKRGREAVASEVLPDRSVWADRRWTLQELVEAGDQVVALVREERRGRGSGVEVVADIALVYSFRDGKVALVEPYLDRSEALASVGLS
jgi:ketosteroid isomerase-like protein